MGIPRCHAQHLAVYFDVDAHLAVGIFQGECAGVFVHGGGFEAGRFAYRGDRFQRLFGRFSDQVPLVIDERLVEEARDFDSLDDSGRAKRKRHDGAGVDGNDAGADRYCAKPRSLSALGNLKLPVVKIISPAVTITAVFDSEDAFDFGLVALADRESGNFIFHGDLGNKFGR